MIDLTLLIGWWLVPALITIAAIFYWFRFTRRAGTLSYGRSSLIDGFAWMFVTAVVFVVILVPWLIWALLT